MYEAYLEVPEGWGIPSMREIWMFSATGTYNVLFLLILQKLGHRLSALNNTNWIEQTKDEIKQVLTVDYTSSDESSCEPDSDYEVPQLQNYRVKHLK